LLYTTIGEFEEGIKPPQAALDARTDGVVDFSSRYRSFKQCRHISSFAPTLAYERTVAYSCNPKTQRRRFTMSPSDG